MKNNEWRKPTPGLYDVEKHFEVGDRVTVSKIQSVSSAQQSEPTSALLQWTNDSTIEGRVQ